MADGRLSRCKTCVKSRVGRHREQNIESIREYDRKRGRTNQRRLKAKLFSRRYIADGRHAEVVKRWRERNPEKYRAQTALNNALKSGKIERGRCEVCGRRKGVEGHHDDYAKPLEVRWRCKKHHESLHH